MKIHFETLGCRLNQDETEGAAHVFSENGFLIDLEPLTAKSFIDEDVCLSVINTCTVTAKAEQKARRIIRLMAEKNPKALILVTGCYAEYDRESIKNIKKGSISVLAGRKKSVLCLIAAAMKEGGILSPFDNRLNEKSLDDFIASAELMVQGTPSAFSEERLAETKAERISLSSKIAPSLNNFLQKENASLFNSFTLYTPVFEKHSRASIKIQDGCNNSCSFCRIHLARGRSVSLDESEVIRRVKELEKKGVCEVVFTGVNLSQYAGKNEKGGRSDFSLLLENLLKETSKIRFRVSSFYPQHINERLCQVLEDERVQPSFHLSIQSGSDRILSLMERPYGFSDVEKALFLLRKAKKNPFISCDIIAGFPGESEDDFEKTKKMCNEAHFAWIHAFPYSPRKDTKAALMKDQISEKIKAERVSWLTEKAKEEKKLYIKNCLGQSFVAVVENSRQIRRGLKDNVLHAVTSNFLHVEVPLKEGILPGQEVLVRIEEVLENEIDEGKEIECRGIIL